MSIRYANVYSQISIEQFKKAAEQFLADNNMSARDWDLETYTMLRELVEKIKLFHYASFDLRSTSPSFDGEIVKKETKDPSCSKTSSSAAGYYGPSRPSKGSCEDMAGLVFDRNAYVETSTDDF